VKIIGGGLSKDEFILIDLNCLLAAEFGRIELFLEELFKVREKPALLIFILNKLLFFL
jgi:hypothetical protein